MKTTEYLLYKSRMKNNYTNGSVEIKICATGKYLTKSTLATSCYLFTSGTFLFIMYFFVIMYLFPFVLCNVRFSYLLMSMYCIFPRYGLNAFWTYSDKIRICNSSFTSHLLLFSMSFYRPNQHW